VHFSEVEHLAEVEKVFEIRNVLLSLHRPRKLVLPVVGLFVCLLLTSHKN